MCGLTGYFASSNREQQVVLIGLTEAIRHRGPDDDGIWISADKKIGLGHRRLSIQDVSPLGKQPMRSRSGRYVIAFNGEIYGFIDLRDQLIKLGHTFKGRSDTEVILAGFEEWGIVNTITKMDGMFAAAVVDTQKRTLYLIRDRVGVKPLYYQWAGTDLYFSSELTKPFARLSNREISQDALALYFRYNYIPAPLTIFSGVRKLQPGQIVEVTVASAQRGEFAQSVFYWDAAFAINECLRQRNESMTMDEAVDLVEDALSTSVRKRMIADVPLGAFLSGGIDSSLIAAHMRALSEKPIKTFTIGFLEEEISESHHAKKIAQHLGTEHTELVVTERDALDVIPLIPSMYGEPFADSSQIPTFLISRLTRKHVTVALSGDGGDELFGGYGSYQTLARVQRYTGLVPSALYGLAANVFRSKKFCRWYAQQFGEQKYDWTFNALRLFSQSHVSGLSCEQFGRNSLSERLLAQEAAGASLLPYSRCSGNVAEQMMCHDLKVYHPDDILTKVDRASMAVSLEVRIPFIDDPNLFRVAAQIPFRHKIGPAGGKLVLKQALGRHVPKSLFDRPKKGFSVPLGAWLNGPLKDWMRSCTESEKISREGILRPDTVAELVAKSRSGDEWYSYKLWAVCVFQSWIDQVN